MDEEPEEPPEEPKAPPEEWEDDTEAPLDGDESAIDLIYTEKEVAEQRGTGKKSEDREMPGRRGNGNGRKDKD